MRIRIHHACIITDNFDWYENFFKNVLTMQISETRGEAPKRRVWFAEGIQINEDMNAPALLPAGLLDHISLGVDDIPATVALAIEHGCKPDPKGTHWFVLPNGVRVELKAY